MSYFIMFSAHARMHTHTHNMLIVGIFVQDLPIKQKYLVTFTVGLDQKHNIDAAVKKVSPFGVLVSETEFLKLQLLRNN